MLEWTQSFGAAFSAVLEKKRVERVAQRLERAGYVDLYSLVLGADDFLEIDGEFEDGVEEERLLPSEARRAASECASRHLCETGTRQGQAASCAAVSQQAESQPGRQGQARPVGR